MRYVSPYGDILREILSFWGEIPAFDWGKVIGEHTFMNPIDWEMPKNSNHLQSRGPHPAPIPAKPSLVWLYLPVAQPWWCRDLLWD